jgi:hypothetical protein
MKRGQKMSPERLAQHRKTQLEKLIRHNYSEHITFAHVARQIKLGIDNQVDEGELGVKELLSKYIHDNPEVENCDDPSDLVLGGWECEKSPTGYCVYHDEDSMHDTCLFCGDPEERK